MAYASCMDERSFRLPSIGQFLHWCVAAVGGLTKPVNPKGSLRKTTDRLRDEVDVEPSKFDDVLAFVEARADTFTQGFRSHWLSGARWREIFSAYQFLTVTAVTTHARSEIVAGALLREVLGWFARSLWQYWDAETSPGLYRDKILWFVDDEPDGWKVPQQRMILRLKERMVGLDASELKFAHALSGVLDEEVTDDTERERLRQLQGWAPGQESMSTLMLEAIAHGLQRREAAKSSGSVPTTAEELREAFLVCSFMRSLPQIAKYFEQPQDVQATAHQLFIGVLQSERNLLVGIPGMRGYIPSRHGVTAEERLEYYAAFVAPSLVDDESEKADNTENQTSRIEELLAVFDPDHSDPAVPEQLRSIAKSADRRNGPVFAHAIETLLTLSDFIDADSVDGRSIKWAMQQAHLHGAMQAPFRASKTWREANLAAARMYAEYLGGMRPLWNASLREISQATTASHGPRDEEIAKLMSYRKDRIDQPIRFKPYIRNRLMLAVNFRMYDLCRQLIEDGASPCMLSESRGKHIGDNGSALLFAVQRYKHAYLRSKVAECWQIRRLIDLMAETTNGSPDCIDVPSKVRNNTCLGEAISSTDPDLVEKILAMGANVERLTGGDEFSPLYLALNEMWHSTARRSLGVVDFLTTVWTISGMNPQRMRLPPGLSTMTEDGLRRHFLALLKQEETSKVLSLAEYANRPESPGDVERLMRILSILLEHGSDPNVVCRNGFSPLGFCREITQYGTVGEDAAELLRRYGAIVDVPLPESDRSV